jgi:hypothetical protein
VKKLAREFAMPGTRDRTPNEEIEVQLRHEEACNADPVKFKKMARKYLGSGYMKNGPE